MASYLRTHRLWKNSRVLWRTMPASLHHTIQQMCRGAELPICQKALVGYTKCFSTVADFVDLTKDRVTSSTTEAPELNSVSTRDSQRHNSTETSVNKKFILKKLHSRVLDRAVVFSETETLNKVVQDQCEEDSFGTIRGKVEKMSKETKLHRSKVVKERSDKPFENIGNTKRFSSLAQEGEDVLHDRGNQRDTVISEADVFGTLTDVKEDNIELVDAEPVVYRDDEGEVDESEQPYQRLSPIHRRHAPVWYGRQIEKLARDGKIYEAIDMFETTMLKEDRVEPNRYIFTVLIGVLGRVGYTKKAFQLYNRMKKFGLEPEDPTYTALFNACSNSPWKEDGLTRAKHLHDLMLEKGYQPNTTTSHAMIKAYGRCGDLQRAFVVMDEMLAAGLRPNAETFSFLLMACISDREAGLKHAIEVWRRMRTKKISPEIHQYNLLLRAVRDCGIGGIEFAQQLIRKKPAIDAPREAITTIEAPREDTSIDFPKHDGYMVLGRLGGGEEQIRDTTTTMKLVDVQDVSDEVANKEIDSGEKEKEHKYWWQYDNKVKPEKQPNPKPALVQSTSEQKPAVLPANTKDGEPTLSGVSVLNMAVPNILNPRGRFQNVMSLNDLDTPTKRLALIGGMPGFLSHMRKDGVAPDIRTFTQLLDTIPSSRDAETDLLAAMSVHKVKHDVDFFNLLIRKRNLREDYSAARDVFGMLSQLGLTPNLHTFGCAAMGCLSRSDGLQLLKEMEEIGYEPNVEIFSILIFRSRMNFAYKRVLCREMKRCDVKPNENVLRRIEQSIAHAKQMILKKEHRQPVGEFYKSSEFTRDFRHFMLYYKSWLLSMQLDVPPHPWHAYHVPSAASEHTEDDINTVNT